MAVSVEVKKKKKKKKKKKMWSIPITHPGTIIYIA